MIPKIIHYCWVGDSPLPAKMKACIASWKRVMPEAEIREWNESNYDFHKIPYMHQAYEQKKWGFVPDYARLDIIYQHGGIYLDTDVEMLKPLDRFLDAPAFCGFESKERVALGLIFAAEPGNALIKAMRDEYEGMAFNLKPSPQIQTEFLQRRGLRPDDGTVQDVDGMKVYPKEYFAPKSLDGECRLTANSHCIHHYEASWVPFRWKVQRKIRRLLEAVLGEKVTMIFVRIKRKFCPEFT